MQESQGSGNLLGPSHPLGGKNTKVKTTLPIGDPTARAAERLLERKRIGLESAIEALETVGYAVTVNAEGRYTVTPPTGEAVVPAVPAEQP